MYCNDCEEFWIAFLSLPQPSAFLGTGNVCIGSSRVDSIMIFREGVCPEWEDPANAEGGHFQFHWKPVGVTPGELDEYWNNIVLAMIGDTLESEGEFAENPIIKGVRLVDKTSAVGKQAGIRIEVWHGKPQDGRHLQKVRSRLERAMALHLDGSSGLIPRCDLRTHQGRSSTAPPVV